LELENIFTFMNSVCGTDWGRGSDGNLNIHTQDNNKNFSDIYTNVITIIYKNKKMYELVYTNIYTYVKTNV
jgi:hypothetical protein